MELLDETLERAEGLLHQRRFNDAFSELSSVWAFQLAGAERMVRELHQDILLQERVKRHKKLLRLLRRKAGFLRRLWFRLM
jgi:hypothetical protein